MDKYIQILDNTIETFKKHYPECYGFIQIKIPDIRNETIGVIEQYKLNVKILGFSEAIEELEEKYFKSAKETYTIGTNYMAAHNGRDYRSAAKPILYGMLELAWINEFINKAPDKMETIEISNCGDPFEELFEEAYKPFINEFIKALGTRIVSADGEWIGTKQKAKVFYDVLLSESIVKKVTTRELAKIFQSKFNLNPSFVTQIPGYKANEFKDGFELEVKLIKNKINHK